MPVGQPLPKPSRPQQTCVADVEHFRLHQPPPKRLRTRSPASEPPPEPAEPEPIAPHLAEALSLAPPSAQSSGLTELPRKRKAQPPQNRAQSAASSAQSAASSAQSAHSAQSAAQSAKHEQSSEQSSNHEQSSAQSAKRKAPNPPGKADASKAEPSNTQSTASLLTLPRAFIPR